MTSSQQDWARPVVHWAIEARDTEVIKRFYGELFSWEIEGEPGFFSIEAGLGGPEPGPGGHIEGGGGSRIHLYVQVRSIPETLERVPGLGGTVAGEAFDVPGGPTICPIDDPEGNRIVLVQQ